MNSVTSMSCTVRGSCPCVILCAPAYYHRSYYVGVYTVHNDGIVASYHTIISRTAHTAKKETRYVYTPLTLQRAHTCIHSMMESPLPKDDSELIVEYEMKANDERGS